MNTKIILKVLECFQKLGNNFPVAPGTILQNDETNILAGIHFSKIEIEAERKIWIAEEIAKLEEYFKINHIVITERVILFQGELKK